MKARTSIRFLALCSALALGACGGQDNNGTSGGTAVPSGPEAGRVEFDAQSYSVNESDGTATIRVIRSGGTEGAVQVTVVSDGGNATAGQDYAAVSSTVDFAAGDAAVKTVAVAITDDAVSETNETIHLRLSQVQGATLGAVSSAVLTIVDGDTGAASAPRVALGLEKRAVRLDWNASTGVTSYRVLMRANANATLAQVGADLPATQRSLAIPVAVHLFDWAGAQFVVQACNAVGCVDSNAASVAGSMAAAIGYLKASNTADFQYFGTALDLSDDGNTLVVGSSGEKSPASGINGSQTNDCGATVPVQCAVNAGAVYVFVRAGDSWSQQAYVKAANAQADDAFGVAVSLSADGNTLLVGASAEDGGSANPNDNSAMNAGAAYVFTRTGTTWTQQAYLKAANADTFDFFGAAVALSADGNFAVIGANGEDSADGNPANNVAASAGAAYVFSRSGSSWSQQAYLKASIPGAGDSFGEHVALNAAGDLLALGAPGEDSGTGNPTDDSVLGAGAVYVFARSGATWSQEAYLKASFIHSFANFGSALAMSDDGSILSIGAESEDGGASGVGGNPNNDCGAPTPTNCVASSGAVYVFSRAASVWTAQAYIKASNPDVFDNFGATLVFSNDGRYLAVGAPPEQSGAAGLNGNPVDDCFQLEANCANGSGAVYLYERTGSTWAFVSYIKASVPQASAAFGEALAFGADGNLLVIGAPGEGSPAAGVEASQANDCTSANPVTCANGAGAVYMY